MKNKSTKERILEALEDRKGKIVKMKVSQASYDEINKIRKKLGLGKLTFKVGDEYEVLIK